MKVVGYRDLRPLDWLSGKRMPLEPGEGHICDRCGAEHAIVYEIMDTETSKVYAVGSGCAKQQFGFEPDKTTEAKRFIKAVNKQIVADIHAKRHEAIAEQARQIVNQVVGLAIPSITRETSTNKYTGKNEIWWTCQDNRFLQPGYAAEEAARGMVVSGWFRNRVEERVPAEWKGVVIGNRSDNPRSYAESMFRLCATRAMKTLYEMKHTTFY